MSGLAQMHWFEGSSWWGCWAYMMYIYYIYIYIYTKSYMKVPPPWCVSWIFHAQPVTIRCATSLVSLRTDGEESDTRVVLESILCIPVLWGVAMWDVATLRLYLSRIPVSWMSKVDERWWKPDTSENLFFSRLKWRSKMNSRTQKEFNETQNVISVIVTWFNASF